jgi:hypothetical protein
MKTFSGGGMIVKCIDCNTEFNKEQRSKTLRCIPCRSKYEKEWHRNYSKNHYKIMKNTEVFSESSRKYNEKNRKVCVLSMAKVFFALSFNVQSGDLPKEMSTDKILRKYRKILLLKRTIKRVTKEVFNGKKNKKVFDSRKRRSNVGSDLSSSS